MKEFEEAQQQLKNAVDFYKHISNKNNDSSFDVGLAWKKFILQQEVKVSNFWKTIDKE